LRQLPDDSRDALAGVSQLFDAALGDVLFREGHTPGGVFLIVKGRVKVVQTAADGREQVLHEEGAGATLAEVPTFDGGGCIGTAVVSEAATILKVPADPLLKVIERYPSTSRAAIAVLAARLRKIAGLASELSFKPISDRLAVYLCRESRRTGSITLTLPETRDDLAAHIGTVREQASRALSQLARAGLIEVRGRTVVITNQPRLQAFAGIEHDSIPNGAPDATP
jgi:CRP-like cAMP-binding protein